MKERLIVCNAEPHPPGCICARLAMEAMEERDRYKAALEVCSEYLDWAPRQNTERAEQIAKAHIAARSAVAIAFRHPAIWEEK